MILRFQCPECQTITATEQVGAPSWTCSTCGFAVTAASPTDASELKSCRVCGNTELYVQKAFAHWLGMSLIVVASVGFIVAMYMYHLYIAWGILIGSALIDVVLYLMMGNMTVCYRCRAQYQGFPVNPEHKSFDLAVGERYRQEKLRRQQL
jgi:hypothetical protein